MNIQYVEFDRFWAVYPRRQQRKTASKSWEKLKVTEDLFSRIKQNIVDRLQSQEWSLLDKVHIPHASTYLNQERWDDEIIVRRAPHEISKRPDKPRSAVDRVREARLKRESARSGHGQPVGAHDENVRAHVGDGIRDGANGKLGAVFDGDYSVYDD